MKRSICLMLTALMMFFAVSPAVLPVIGAEAIQTVEMIGAFHVIVSVPKGYTYEDRWVHDMSYLAYLTPEDPEAPRAAFTIAQSELYEGRTLNDFTDEEISELIAIFVEPYDEPEHWITETGMGTKLIVLKEKSAADNHVEIVTVYQGYEISVLIEPGVPGAMLTDAQIQLAVDILTDMQITE